MQSKATTVAKYLAELSDDRRAAISAVRDVILKNLDTAGGFIEGMQYGMIGYAVSHKVYPAGYHCDPKQPLPFVALASQKNHMALYMMCFWGDDEAYNAFAKAWSKSGKKLDMGKSCIRFKKLDDLSLPVIADTIRKIPVKKFVKYYEALLARSVKRPAKKTSAKKPAAGKSRSTAASGRKTTAR